MPERSLPIVQILTMLESAPQRLTELTAGLTQTQLHAAPRRGEWSANAVLAHLRSCADVWDDCMMTIVSQDTPTIRAVNPRTWVESTDYPEQEFYPSLQAFAGQRARLLAVLKPLKLKSWSRSATVTGAGRPLVRTVHFYAQWMATHERPHVKQIERIVKAIAKEPCPLGSANS